MSPPPLCRPIRSLGAKSCATVSSLLLAVAVLASPTTGQTPPALEYRNHESRVAHLKKIVASAQRRGIAARVVEVGTSHEGRKILAVEVGFDPDAGTPPKDAPGAVKRAWGKRAALLIVAGLESDRILGCAVAERLLETLLSADGAALQERLHQHELYVVPCADPDGIERYFSDAPRDGHRGNGRGIDWDRDGRQGEDPPQDVDGDRMVLSMRVREADGKLIVDPDDERALREAEPNKGERGIFNLYPEGLDKDGDGAWGEDGPAGVEINRNFPHRFSEHDLAAGTLAASEPEVRGLMEYCIDRPNIALVLAIGAHDNLVDPPKKPEKSKKKEDSKKEERSRFSRRGREQVVKVQPDDAEIFIELGKSWREMTKLESEGTGAEGGAFHEWAYFHRGIPALAVNLFEVPEKHSKKKKGDDDEGEEKPGSETKPPEKVEKDIVARHVEELDQSGFVAWKKAEHPSFEGLAVEVGGWKPYVRTTPSKEVAGIIATRVGLFVEELLARFSNTHLEDLKVKRLASGIHEIKVVISNDGWLPSATAQGRRARSVRPTLVELAVEKDDLLHGTRRHLIDRLEPRAGVRHFRWLVRGAAGRKLELRVAPPHRQCKTWEVILP